MQLIYSVAQRTKGVRDYGSDDMLDQLRDKLTEALVKARAGRAAGPGLVVALALGFWRYGGVGHRAEPFMGIMGYYNTTFRRRIASRKVRFRSFATDQRHSISLLTSSAKSKTKWIADAVWPGDPGEAVGGAAEMIRSWHHSWFRIRHPAEY